MSAQDHSSLKMPKGAEFITRPRIILISTITLCVVGIALTLAPSHAGTSHHWQLAWPDDTIFNLRWPQLLAAAAAGSGIAIAGVILQRLIRNPLASPDILGLSAGATLALILGTYILGTSINELGPAVAFIGSIAALLILIMLGRRNNYAPGVMILTGISLAAFIEGVVHFTLAKGGEEIYSIIGWLAGSTYHVNQSEALTLAAVITLLAAFSILAHRQLTLISAGDGMADARGLNARRARLSLLVLVALLCSMVTAFLGPIAFVGLLAPHMAALMGARQAKQQLLLAMLIGALLMLISDWMGRTLIYPAQLPAGVIASVIGGSYFVFLLARGKKMG